MSAGYRHPHGAIVTGPVISAPADQVEALADEWRWTLRRGDPLRWNVAVCRALGLPDHADSSRAVHADRRTGDELAAAFQFVYQQMEAERPTDALDDDVAVWVRSARDAYPSGTPEWYALDRLLDDHRARLAAASTPEGTAQP